MPAEELRSFRVIPNPDGIVTVDELTDAWHPLVVTPGENMASDAEVAAAIMAHAALPNAHHPANVGVTGTKTVGSYKFTFTNGLLTGFEQV